MQGVRPRVWGHGCRQRLTDSRIRCSRLGASNCRAEGSLSVMLEAVHVLNADELRAEAVGGAAMVPAVLFTSNYTPYSYRKLPLQN